MPTLILPPRITDDSVRLWRAATAAGWHTHRLDKWEAPIDVVPAEVVVYGGYFVVLLEDLGVSLLEPKVDWLAHVPTALTNRRVRYMTLAEARSLTDRAFYKPSDDKCFVAKIYDGGRQLPPAGELPDDVPVLISDIVEWGIEFRCYILEGKVITLSPYLRRGKRVDTPEGEWIATDEEFADAESFATKVAAAEKNNLPPGIVVDVGHIPGVGWSVIEANAAWASGIYGCGASAILPILRRVCVPTATLTAADATFAAIRK